MNGLDVNKIFKIKTESPAVGLGDIATNIENKNEIWPSINSPVKIKRNVFTVFIN